MYGEKKIAVDVCADFGVANFVLRFANVIATIITISLVDVVETSLSVVINN